MRRAGHRGRASEAAVARRGAAARAARRSTRSARLDEPPPTGGEYIAPGADPHLHRVARQAARHGPAPWPRREWPRGAQDLRDHHPRDGRARDGATWRALREEFGIGFAQFIHILDPLEPGIVVGKSSAMAWGGRYLYRLLVREQGMDPRRILVTDLDADYRVHPQYFTYLTWMHLTDPNRETQLYQPIPYFHNNLWQAPLLQRLFAAVLTQLQMWRSVLPEKLQSFGSYSTTLQPGPRGRLLGHRCDPRGQPLLLEELLPLRRSLPGGAALHPDLRRRGAGPDLLALDGAAVPAGTALGVGRDRHPVRGAERHPPPRDPAQLAGLAAAEPVRRAHQLGDRPVRDHVRRDGAARHQPGVRRDDARARTCRSTLPPC